MLNWQGLFAGFSSFAANMWVLDLLYGLRICLFQNFTGSNTDIRWPDSLPIGSGLKDLTHRLWAQGLDVSYFSCRADGHRPLPGVQSLAPSASYQRPCVRVGLGLHPRWNALGRLSGGRCNHAHFGTLAGLYLIIRDPFVAEDSLRNGEQRICFAYREFQE